MSSIKQRLLEAIETAPDPLLEEMLIFLNDRMAQSQQSLPEAGFNPSNDSKAQILADLKTSFQQAKTGQTFPISELWDGIDV